MISNVSDKLSKKLLRIGVLLGYIIAVEDFFSRIKLTRYFLRFLCCFSSRCTVSIQSDKSAIGRANHSSDPLPVSARANAIHACRIGAKGSLTLSPKQSKNCSPFGLKHSIPVPASQGKIPMVASSNGKGAMRKNLSPLTVMENNSP